MKNRRIKNKRIKKTIEKSAKLAEYVLIAPIRFYRRFISPLTPPRCRFYPTCSEYAILAIRKYGSIKGGIKAVWRILRCNPFSRGGIDFP